VISRYTPPAFAELWSDRTKYRTWLEVELAACEAMERAGLVPDGVAVSLKSKSIQIDPAEIERIEQDTRHDVIAFLTHVEQLAGAEARWLHRGLTSIDVLDTSLALLLVRATDLLIERCDQLLGALVARVNEHRHTPMIGRSHGIHAEPTTFGIALGGHLCELKRGKAELVRARRSIAVGKLAGAVGTYAHLTPEIEQQALLALGLEPETVATQVVARDRHAVLFSALALVAAGIERLATNVRHWQRTEVGEAAERFSTGQKGSSAMPHKKNPVLSENLCGLARVVRSAVIPALENVALWHERDISHSSVERMLAPDTTTTLGFMLERARGLVEGLVVNEARLSENLARSGGLFFSEGVMLALVEKGMARQAAYELVQRNALRAFDGAGDFQALLAADSELANRLSQDEIARVFDLKHALRWADTIVDRALELEG
jgi:adenylosuccinate lyase